MKNKILNIFKKPAKKTEKRSETYSLVLRQAIKNVAKYEGGKVKIL